MNEIKIALSNFYAIATGNETIFRIEIAYILVPVSYDQETCTEAETVVFEETYVYT